MELKNIRQNVFRFLIRQNNVVKLDDCIALIITEILGYINVRNSIQYSPFDELCLKVTNFKKLTKQALIKKIKSEILENLSIEDQRKLLGETMIYSFDKENIVFSDKFISISKEQPINLRNDYGDKEFENTNTVKLPTQKNDKKEQTQQKNKKQYFLCPEETALNEFWKTIETEDRKKLFPFWKWKLSTAEFQSLEESLIALIKRKDQRKVTENHAFKIALFYSEWYKRKYTGNDSYIDAVFETISAQSIWHHLSAEIQNDYLITVNESTRWDDSMKLLGGLPLSYLTKGGNNTSRVFTKIFKDIRSGDTPDLNTLDVNNQAMRQSAYKGGSIYEYIQELNNERFPYAETDKAESPFIEFIDFVKTGLKESKESKPKKFTIQWQVRQHTDFDNLYPAIYLKLKPEQGGEDHRFIHDERLNEWGIQDIHSSFEIIIRLKYLHSDILNEIGGFYFNRCANGKFLSRNGSKWKICDNPKNLESIEIILKTGQLEESIQKEKVPNYIQLWKSGYGEWTNRQINGSKSSVLLLNDNATTQNADQRITLKSKGQEYYWAIINKELEIVSNGVSKILYQKKGAIEVYPQNNDLFKNTILYNENGMLSYVVGEITSPVFLVKDPISFYVFFIDSIDSIKVQISFDDYSVQYNEPGKNGFQPYTTETSLKQGFVSFKITYKDIYIETIDCYVLYPKANIKRVLDTKRIHFQNIDDLALINNEYIDNENKLETDTIPIKIGIGGRYLEIPVYRPLARKNDLFQDKKYIDNRDTIPIKFTDNFEVRTINKEGVIRKVLSNEITKFQKIRVIYYNNLGKNDETGITGMLKGIRLITYTKEIGRNGNFYFLVEGENISLENFSQYKFCFLSLEGNKVENLKLEIHRNKTGNYVGFFIRSTDDGIVFQSFKDNEPPFQETYRPFFVASNQSKLKSIVKKENRKARIEKYEQKFDFELARNHFAIATEHNLYFGIFDILLAMEKKPLTLAQFFLQYYQHCEKQLKPVDFKSLHRLAEELLFDWILIPRKIWSEAIRESGGKEDWVTKLFGSKNTASGLEQHALNQCCEKYWESKLLAPNQNNEIYKNIKKVKKIDSYFLGSPEQKIGYLRNIENNETTYVSLLEILQK